MMKVKTDSRISWCQASTTPNPARKDSSLCTTTSTAKPISKGGAKSHILFSTEHSVARRIVPLCGDMYRNNLLNGPPSLMLRLGA